jgi:hypothetical protein
MDYARRINPGYAGSSARRNILGDRIIDRNPKGLQIRTPHWKNLTAFRLSYYNQNDSIPRADNID